MRIFVFGVLISLCCVCACDDKSASELSTLDASDTSNDAVDGQLLTQKLVGAWSWEMITAALCNDDRYTWVFSERGAVDYTVSSDRGPDPSINVCEVDTSTNTGQFSVDAQGVVHIEVGDTVRAWQVAVFDAIPDYEGKDADPMYRSINNKMTTQAFVSRGDAKTFHQMYAGPAFYSDSQDALSTTLTFDAILALGSCRFTVTAEAQSVSESKGDSTATDTFSANCRIDTTGLDDWMAVISTEEIERESLPSDASNAEKNVRTIRNQFWRSNAPVLYYRSGAPNTMIYPDYCCSDIWMNGQ